MDWTADRGNSVGAFSKALILRDKPKQKLSIQTINAIFKQEVFPMLNKVASALCVRL
jgi:hypothetical protein